MWDILCAVCPADPLSPPLHLVPYPSTEFVPGPFCCLHLSWVQSVEGARRIWKKEREVTAFIHHSFIHSTEGHLSWNYVSFPTAMQVLPGSGNCPFYLTLQIRPATEDTGLKDEQIWGD